MAQLSSHFIFPPTLTNGAFPLASHRLSMADLLCHSSHLVHCLYCPPCSHGRDPVSSKKTHRHKTSVILPTPLSSDHFPYCVALQAESSLPPLCVPGLHAYSLCLIRELQHSACKNSNGHLPVDKQLCLYCVHGVISCLDQQPVVHFTSLQPKLLGSN